MKIQPSQIAHFSFMSPEAKKVIKSADSIEANDAGHIIGSINGHVVWEAAGHFEEMSRFWHLGSLGDGKQIPLWGPLFWAVEQGKASFLRGESAGPGPELFAAVGNEAGASIPTLKAWNAGWHLANIEAPIDE